MQIRLPIDFPDPIIKDIFLLQILPFRSRLHTALLCYALLGDYAKLKCQVRL